MKHYKSLLYDRSNLYALRHIQEATEFSSYVGGTDKDVKDYFFHLSKKRFNRVISEYSKNFGEGAREYAVSTYPKWKSGKVQMLGLVAKRLFDILPQFMTYQEKLDLADNVWKHFGPSSKTSYRVTASTDVVNFANKIAEKLNEVVVAYKIPEEVKKRFKWLASGDVAVEEQLLNHFQEVQKKLVVNKILVELPLLQQKFSTNNYIKECSSTIVINKHSIHIEVCKNLREKSPVCDCEKVENKMSNTNTDYVASILAYIVLIVISPVLLLVTIPRLILSSHNEKHAKR